MKKFFILFVLVLLSACTSSGPKYRSLYVDVNKTDKEPTSAVYTSLRPVEGPDGVCVYVKGKCDNSELDFLKEDLYNAYGSRYLANVQANLIYAENHKYDGKGWMVIDSDIKKHENPYKTKSNNVVITPDYNVINGSHYYTATLHYKNQKIGEIRTGGYNAYFNSKDTEWLKEVVPMVAWCAATVGYQGKLGGEKAKEGQDRSPSMVEFFKGCGINYE